MATVTKPVALDESINTTENTPRNIADVLADELSNIADKIQGGGGSGGGHVIQNSQGANLTQRGTMQFVDSHVTDDSTNEKTVIENIKSVTEAQFESATEDGLYDVDVEGVEIGEISEEYVEVEADGVKTLTQLFVELINKCDTSKLNGNSYIKQPNGDLLYYQYPICFSRVRTSNADSSILSFIYQGNNTAICFYSIITSSGTTINNGDSTLTNGEKLTLYYGNDKAVVDLQTTANRCLRPNGDTVEQWLPKSAEITATTDSGGNISISASTVEIILARFKTNSGSPRICTPFYGNGATYINVKDLSGNNITNTSVTIKYYYI